MTKTVNRRTLQELIDSVPSLVDYFYNETLAPHASNRLGILPIPAEFTNWRDEQRAWRESVLLFDQSHHMPESFIAGPDAQRLLNYLGINTFQKFEPLRAKQYVACNHKGQVIGECILQHLEDGTYELISGMHLQNWVQYNAEVGGYKVRMLRDNHSAENTTGRTNYRYQLEGPFAETLLAEVTGREMPDIPFFRLACVTIAGCDVHVLRHGMVATTGVELSGLYAEGPRVRAALLAAGAKHDIVQAGLKTYFSTLGESGWIGYPTPAIYTDPELAAFRNWLPADGWEAQTQLAGSFRSQNIEDYYVTPWDLGLERLLKFDHDFIGREALEKMAAQGNHRKKVTLVWDNEDVKRIYASMLEPGLAYKSLELPKSSYGFQQCDEVRNRSGQLVGLSNFVGYTVNEAKFLSIAIVDASEAAPGTEVIVTWGEPDGGSQKPTVERHRQTAVRATVARVPYVQGK
jgi:vanillate/3-O-methylgallate O-demethylase